MIRALLSSLRAQSGSVGEKRGEKEMSAFHVLLDTVFGHSVDRHRGGTDTEDGQPRSARLVSPPADGQAVCCTTLFPKKFLSDSLLPLFPRLVHRPSKGADLIKLL